MGFIERLGKMGIPGFRSGKKWKMALAILGYFLLFLILLALIYPSPTPREPTRAAITPAPTATQAVAPTILATAAIPILTPTPTPSPTPALTPIPTPSPIPTQVIGPKILSSSEYIGDLGYYTVVGEVQNNLQSNIQYVKLTATFYDAQNTVIGMDFTYTDIGTLKPGQKSPFEISSYPEKISPSRYKLSLDYSLTSSEPFSGLEILSQSSKIDDLGYHKIVGEVKNNGVRKASFVKVVVTYYDSAGNVIDKSFSYTNPQDIANGDTAPFEVSSYPRKISPAKYEIQVEGE